MAVRSPSIRPMSKDENYESMLLLRYVTSGYDIVASRMDVCINRAT